MKVEVGGGVSVGVFDGVREAVNVFVGVFDGVLLGVNVNVGV